MILPICVISLYCNIKHLFETWKYLYKSGSSDDKCIDSQHFGTCDSHTDFKVRNVKSQSHGAGAYCGGHLAAQLVDEKLSGDNRCRPIQYSCIYFYVASWMQLRVDSDVGLALLRSARETRIFCCGVCCLHDIAVIFEVHVRYTWTDLMLYTKQQLQTAWCVWLWAVVERLIGLLTGVCIRNSLRVWSC